MGWIAGKMQKKFTLKGIDHLALFGPQDVNLRTIQKHFDARIVLRGDTLVLDGSTGEIKQLERLFSELLVLVNRNGGISRADLETLIKLIRSDREEPRGVELDEVIVEGKRDLIRPRTEGQRRYYEAIFENDIVFAIGPAGTGKTYLAVAMAVAHLKSHEVDRIILTRPAVEAGEKLGFLPGDFREKVDPYLRPLWDALYDMLPVDKLRRMMDTGQIEIVPLAYMRGRTLNNAFVILDEAQNTSENQMKMFLTRLGINSKAIITGDITQIDIPDKDRSGLVQVQHILQGIEGIAFIYLTEKDVVRHPLVREIILAYDAYDEQRRKETQNGGPAGQEPAGTGEEAGLN